MTSWTWKKSTWWTAGATWAPRRARPKSMNCSNRPARPASTWTPTGYSRPTWQRGSSSSGGCDPAAPHRARGLNHSPGEPAPSRSSLVRRQAMDHAHHQLLFRRGQLAEVSQESLLESRARQGPGEGQHLTVPVREPVWRLLEHLCHLKQGRMAQGLGPSAFQGAYQRRRNTAAPGEFDLAQSCANPGFLDALGERLGILVYGHIHFAVLQNSLVGGGQRSFPPSWPPSWRKQQPAPLLLTLAYLFRTPAGTRQAPRLVTGGFNGKPALQG